MTSSQPASNLVDTDPPMASDIASTEPMTESIIISTSDGNGADATVSKPKKNDPLGQLVSLTVQTRNGTEVQHAYMRFDLGSLGERKKKIQDAYLVLNLVDGKRPEQAIVKLYATDNKLAEFWKEDAAPRTMMTWKRSFSNAGLDQIQALGEFQLGDKTTGSGAKVRLGGSELGQFIANAKTKTVTLAISGSGVKNAPLSFHSREATSGKPPQLVVKLAK